jgi:hypothetical protein
MTDDASRRTGSTPGAWTAIGLALDRIAGRS